jgi:rod shape-determining protein MreD
VRTPLAWLLLGVVAIAACGALTDLLPARVVPDLSLLAAFAAALVLGPAEALVLAAGFGLAADMLSGALVGQHAFARVFEVVALRAVAGQLELRRPAPQMAAVFVLEIADALLLAGTSALFLERFPLDARVAFDAAVRALVSAGLAPLVARAARALQEAVGEGENRREMRLETRRPVL